MDSNFDKTLVVIPARGGSKRIPRKNVKKIFGQPMIYWPLTELFSLFKPENIIVSTDCDEIKKAVEERGLEVPFRRPDRLSDDFTGTAEVVTHALNWYEENVKKVEFVLTVYPTAVLLNAEDVAVALDTLQADTKCESVMSATNFPFPIQRALFENNGYAEMFQPDNYSKRSQDLIEAKHDAGQFYLSRTQVVRDGKLLTNSKVKLHMLNRDKVVDIDTVEDFEIAENKLRLYKAQ